MVFTVSSFPTAAPTVVRLAVQTAPATGNARPMRNAGTNMNTTPAANEETTRAVNSVASAGTSTPRSCTEILGISCMSSVTASALTPISTCVTPNARTADRPPRPSGAGARRRGCRRRCRRGTRRASP